jgi:hypothetical protein
MSIEDSKRSALPRDIANSSQVLNIDETVAFLEQVNRGTCMQFDIDIDITVTVFQIRTHYSASFTLACFQSETPGLGKATDEMC